MQNSFENFSLKIHWKSKYWWPFEASKMQLTWTLVFMSYKLKRKGGSHNMCVNRFSYKDRVLRYLSSKICKIPTLLYFSFDCILLLTFLEISYQTDDYGIVFYVHFPPNRLRMANDKNCLWQCSKICYFLIIKKNWRNSNNNTNKPNKYSQISHFILFWILCFFFK